MNPQDVQAFIKLMKDEGLVYLRVGELELRAGAPMVPEEPKDAAPVGPEPLRDPLDDPNAWPGGRIMRLKRRDPGDIR